MSRLQLVTALFAITGVCCTFAVAAAPQGGVDSQRVKEITGMLDDKPFAFGPKINDRAAWEQIARSAGLGEVVAKAEKAATEPIPETTDELYLQYSRNGNRDNYQNAYFGRTTRLATLVLAECVENKGRFVQPIEKLIEALCSQKTWVLPAHDANLDNFNGKNITIDLFSSAIAYELAQIAWTMGERLSPATRQLIDENVHRRVLDPIHKTYGGNRTAEWWFTADMNWNSVCLDGVTGAAMATLESREDRALFAAAAEKYSQNFLKGFGTDGYCSEGLGYWNYGFGNYVQLAELLSQATKGRLDLFDRPMVRQVALFPRRIEIMNDVYPAYADCTVDARPDPALTSFLNDRLGLAVADWRLKEPLGPRPSFRFTMMYASQTPSSAGVMTPHHLVAPTLRDWFDQAHILTARPAPGSACRMGISLKGGNNNENHNHNDVGSYVVVVGKTALLLDPGPEVYTSRTFGKNRYDSKVLNSFGHAVPMVAGQLQRTGAAAHAVLASSEFTDATDTVIFDIKSCYDVKSLQKLQRTFVYSRANEGAFSASDEVSFDSPQQFGTALITLSKWKQLSPTSLLVWSEPNSKDALRVDIDAHGEPFEIVAEEIHEQVRTPTLPVRIGIDLKRPVTTATVEVRVLPAISGE